MRRLIRFAFLAMLGASAGRGTAGHRQVEWPQAVRAFASGQEVSATARLFPNSAGMQRRRLAAALAAADPGGALDAVRRLAAMGAVLTAGEQRQVAQVVGEAAMAPLVRRFAANAEPIVRSTAFAAVPAGQHLVEGVVWDPGARRLYATTVVGGRLIAVDGRAALTQPTGALLGALYDRRRRRIWAASADIDLAARDRPPFAGLVSIGPTDFTDIRRIPAPAGASPGDVALAADGTVYASDGMNGAVYRCRPGCTALETMLAAGTLFSAQGMALSPNQRLLYIADRRYGLAALELASGRVLRIAAPPDVMLDGLDALLIWRGDLIATQNAYPPTRIVRLHLAPDGLAVTRLEILERAHPEWGEVTLATLAGGRLLYVADAQWEGWAEGGVPVRAPRPTPIRSLRLR